MVLFQFLFSGYNLDADEGTSKGCYMDKVPEDNSASKAESYLKSFKAPLVPIPQRKAFQLGL